MDKAAHLFGRSQVLLPGRCGTQSVAVDWNGVGTGIATPEDFGTTFLERAFPRVQKVFSDEQVGDPVCGIPIPFGLLNSCETGHYFEDRKSLPSTRIIEVALHHEYQGFNFEDHHVLEEPKSFESLRMKSQHTTLMIRNLPNTVSTIDLKKTVDDTGFADLYDILYVPFRVGNDNKNLGFAFVNFLSQTIADEFSRAWLAFKKDGISVSFANVQGRDENIKMMKKKKLHRIQDPRLKPFVRDR
eukprot:TRINITY_DN33107_c0_g1_i1.p1 TRINITY_DN33107_c0_g1~~TRINITY_DN33107_c0_g1_i1.p1  ORF type:complete len:243 (-),score=40.20 TRINITY_DN33107_c0_g1_i1:122-850(-)